MRKNELETPFGKIRVTCKGRIIPYDFTEEEKVVPYTDDPDHEGTPYTGFYINVEGCFRIWPCLPRSIKTPAEIECSIELSENVVLDNTEPEDGEHLVLRSMYRGSMKVSIGGFDEMPDYLDDSIKGYHVPTGVGIELYNLDYLEYVRFGLAWVTLTGDDYDTNEEIYTWRAADPNE